MIGVIRKRKGKDVYFLDGKEVDKAVFDREMNAARPKVENPRLVGRPRGMKRGYPIKSVAMAVISKNREKAMAEAAKRGVPTEYTPGGRPILRDAGHRKAFLKAFNLHDRNSFSGY